MRVEAFAGRYLSISPNTMSTRLVGLKGDTAAPAQIETGIAELDRVAGRAGAQSWNPRTNDRPVAAT